MSCTNSIGTTRWCFPKSEGIEGTHRKTFFARFGLAFILCAGIPTSEAAAQQIVTHGPWELETNVRAFSSLVLGEEPSPDRQTKGRTLVEGTSIRTEAFGRNVLYPEGRFLELQLVLRNRSEFAQVLTVQAVEDFVLESETGSYSPYGIRTLGITQFESDWRLIRSISGEVQVSVPPESTDSGIVLLFDIPDALDEVYLRFRDFPRVLIPVPPVTSG